MTAVRLRKRKTRQFQRLPVRRLPEDGMSALPQRLTSVLSGADLRLAVSSMIGSQLSKSLMPRGDGESPLARKPYATANGGLARRKQTDVHRHPDC
jgi:hypothetical protein